MNCDSKNPFKKLKIGIMKHLVPAYLSAALNGNDSQRNNNPINVFIGSFVSDMAKVYSSVESHRYQKLDLLKEFKIENIKLLDDQMDVYLEEYEEDKTTDDEDFVLISCIHELYETDMGSNLYNKSNLSADPIEKANEIYDIDKIKASMNNYNAKMITRLSKLKLKSDYNNNERRKIFLGALRNSVDSQDTSSFSKTKQFSDLLIDGLDRKDLEQERFILDNVISIYKDSLSLPKNKQDEVLSFMKSLKESAKKSDYIYFLEKLEIEIPNTD